MTSRLANQPGGASLYGSARDLPSFQEMFEQLQGAKLLTRFVARQERPKVLQIERDLDRLVTVVDSFYDRLGPRNWVFHDVMSLDDIHTILAETSTESEAEDRLIDLYRTDETLNRWIMGLKQHEGLRARFHQIERANEHYRDGRYDSCTLQLIAVMDGFVNDFEPSVRQGLASRDPDEMAAWDSVVGHHMGLTHTLKTFTKTIKRRIDEEVFEVYRHGIVHGSVTRFDNAVVATKAWNMLFAVSDWARATRKSTQPKKERPSWSDTWSTIRRYAAYKRYQEAFEPTSMTPTSTDFAESEVVAAASEFLVAWEHRRWGHVAGFEPPMLAGLGSDGERARFAKETFTDYVLDRWEIESIELEQASTADIKVTSTVNAEARGMKIRMILWTPDGKLAMPDEHGAKWRLAVWAPNAFFDS